MTETLHLNKIVFNEAIYPRSTWDPSTVTLYADAMQNGDQFPPLLLRKGHNDLIDGVHRYKAYCLYRDKYHHQHAENPESVKEWAPPVEQIPVVYKAYPEDMSLADLQLECATYNVSHGKTMSRAERRERARAKVLEDPEYDLKLLAKKLKVSQQTIYNYVDDILHQQKEEKERTVQRLWNSGSTLSMIAEKLECSERTVRRLVDKIQNLKTVTTPFRLDYELMDRLNILRYPLMTQLDEWEYSEFFEGEIHYDTAQRPFYGGCVWRFPTEHEQFFCDYPIIPGELIANLICYFTEQEDVVLDPSARNGTSIDVCQAFNRRCYAYDAVPVRQDIHCHDTLIQGWPTRTKEAAFVFWHLPRVLAHTQETEYISLIRERVNQLFDLAQPGLTLAIYSNDLNWDIREGMVEVWDSPFYFWVEDVFKDTSWKPIEQVLILFDKQIPHESIERAKSSKSFNHVYQKLFIAQKQEEEKVREIFSEETN